MIEAVRDVRKIADKHSSLMAGFQLVEEWPGRDVNSEQEIGDWIRQEAWGHHACCTAAVGLALNNDFTVKGTNGLRVVDASAFRKIPGTFHRSSGLHAQ